MSATKSKQQGWVAVTLAVILVIVLAVVAYFYQQYRSQLADSQQTVSILEQTTERTRSELTTVQTRLAEANSRLRELESERSRLLSDAEATNARLASLQAQYDELRQDAQSSVGDLQTELEQARRDRDELEQTLAEADGLIARQAEQQARLENELSETIGALAAVEAELVAVESELVDSRTEQTAAEGRQTRIADELETTRSELVAVKAELAEAERSLSSRTAQRQTIEAELAEAERRLVSGASEKQAIETELTNIKLRLAMHTTEKRATEAELADAERRIAEQQAELASARSKTDDLNRQLADSQAHVQRLLNERTALLDATQRMEQEGREQQAANARLQQQLDDALAALNVAEVELMRREANLDEAMAERETVVDEYRQAREELALQQARSKNYSETIDELEARLNRETKAMDALQNQLQTLSNERQTLVSRLEDGTTVIKLPESIVFASGSADIGEAGRETLQLLADALVSFPDHLISIQGHSDGRPISPSLQQKYPSNWELSTARAASAVQVLNQSGIESDRMQAVGYADTRPLVEETDAQSRRANRRIEVLLYPNQFTMRVLDQAALETP